MEPDYDSDVYHIRWNTHIHELSKELYRFFVGQQFVDVTLTCKGQSLKCHRLVLSACSIYFHRIICDNPGPNLVIFLNDLEFWELLAIVKFMYCGEVTVCREQLLGLCKAAEVFKVKGFTQTTAANLKRTNEDNGKNFQILEAEKKVLKQPVKLMKNPSNANVGSTLTSQEYSTLVTSGMPIKKHETTYFSDSIVTSKKTVGVEEKDLLAQPPLVVSNVENNKIEKNIQGSKKMTCGENSSGGDSFLSKEDNTDGRHATKCYGKQARDSVLLTLQTEKPSSPCSNSNEINRKILLQWQNDKGIKNFSGLPQKSVWGSPVDAQDRLERMKKGAELAVAGAATVRAIAAHFEIPRTSLCAYMKRHGLKSADRVRVVKETLEESRGSNIDKFGQEEDNKFDCKVHPTLSVGSVELKNKIDQEVYTREG